MADLAQKSSIGVRIESVSGTFNAPTASDVFLVSELQPSIEGLEANIAQLTGSIHRTGPIVLGATMSVTFTVLLAGPGGAAPPAADTWLPGRVFRAAGFSELINATATPVSPEALGGGSTSRNAVLGATASSTDGFYRGLPIQFSGLPVGFRSQTLIRSYVGSTKTAAMMETHTGTLAGTWQQPRYLGYVLSPNDPPTLSVSVWWGNKRYDLVGGAVSSLNVVVPTMSRDSQEIPRMEVTITGDLQAIADATAPVPPSTLAPPPYRDGRLFVSGIRMPGASVSYGLTADVAFAPDPNRVNGVEAAQITGTSRTIDLDLNQVADTIMDYEALVNAQAYDSVFSAWGSAAGNRFLIGAPDTRLAWPTPGDRNGFANTTGRAYVDGANRDLVFFMTW